MFFAAVHTHAAIEKIYFFDRYHWHRCDDPIHTGIHMSIKKINYITN